MMSIVEPLKDPSYKCLKKIIKNLKGKKENLEKYDFLGIENYPRIKDFFTLNMYSEDLDTAVQEMMLTASVNIRSKCSKYMHLVLSLSESEKIDLITWNKIIVEYIKEVGMDNHQVIAIRHNDNGKEHFHLIINRIDTYKFTRVNTYKVFYKLMKFDEFIEKKYVLKQFNHYFKNK